MTTEKYIERTITSGGGGGGPDNAKALSAQEYLHRASVSAGVPLLQSTITGFVFAAPVTVLLLKYHVTDAWFWGFGVWGVVQAATWIITQVHWFGLTDLEKMTGIDLNKDGVIGDAKAIPERTVRVDLHDLSDAGYLSVTTARLPIDDATMAVLASGLLNNIPFAERYWTGAGKILSQTQFREVRAEMFKRGLLEYTNPKSPQQGYQLTRGGRAAMRELSRQPSDPPTPPAGMA